MRAAQAARVGWAKPNAAVHARAWHAALACAASRVRVPLVASAVATAHHNSRKCPVIESTTLLGAGPTASTVCDPAAICVRPASHTMYTGSPAADAFSASASCGHTRQAAELSSRRWGGCAVLHAAKGHWLC